MTSKNNVNLLELNSLSRLTALSLSVSTAQCFPQNFVFPKLHSYIIALNADHYSMKGLTFRTLKIQFFSTSLCAFKEMFCNVEKLSLNSLKKRKNIVPSIDEEGLNELTSLRLTSCPEMECLMDTTGEKGSTTVFSSLVKLDIHSMTCLKELYHGPPSIRFLQKLKDVKIACCKELKEVFQMDGVLDEKEEIVLTPLLSNLTSLDLSSLPELKSIWKLQPTHQHHASLHSLKVVYISLCHKLKSVFSTYLAQTLLHLQQLRIYRSNGLEQLIDFSQVVELEVPLSLSMLALNCFWW